MKTCHAKSESCKILCCMLTKSRPFMTKYDEFAIHNGVSKPNANHFPGKILPAVKKTSKSSSSSTQNSDGSIF